MPILNGFETLKLVKEQFKRHNKRLNEVISSNDGDEETGMLVKSEPPQHLILRPLIIFVSQLDRKQFVDFFEDDEKPDFYLEKPLVPRDLQSILQLVNIL